MQVGKEGWTYSHSEREKVSSTNWSIVRRACLEENVLFKETFEDKGGETSTHKHFNGSFIRRMAEWTSLRKKRHQVQKSQVARNSGKFGSTLWPNFANSTLRSSAQAFQTQLQKFWVLGYCIALISICSKITKASRGRSLFRQPMNTPFDVFMLFSSYQNS